MGMTVTYKCNCDVCDDEIFTFEAPVSAASLPPYVDKLGQFCLCKPCYHLALAKLQSYQTKTKG